MQSTNTQFDSSIETTTSSPVDWRAHDLSKFQLRILAALAHRDYAQSGVDVQRYLKAHFQEDINPGQLYPNLNELADAGLVEKTAEDGRTNAYAISEAGATVLAAEVAWLVERTDGFEEVERA